MHFKCCNILQFYIAQFADDSLRQSNHTEIEMIVENAANEQIFQITLYC